MILAALVGIGIMVTVDDIVRLKRAPAARTFVSLAFLAVILSMLDNFAPDLAQPLALIAFLAVFLQRGSRFFGVFAGGGPRMLERTGSVRVGKQDLPTFRMP